MQQPLGEGSEWPFQIRRRLARSRAANLESQDWPKRTRGRKNGNAKSPAPVFCRRVQSIRPAPDEANGGTVTGNVFATERLVLHKSARVEGDIEAGSIAIEEGAILNGKITMSGMPKRSPSA